MKRPSAATLAWAGLAVGAVASVGGNVAHAYIRPAGASATWHPEVGLVIAAGFAPIGLLVAVELLAQVPWPKGFWWSVARFGGVGLVASVVAVVSYQHLSSLLRHYRETATAILIEPLAVDGLMLVSSAALLAIRMTRTTPASTEATPELPARATETPASASDPDPTEPTPDPPSGESSVGSGAKPEMTPAGDDSLKRSSTDDHGGSPGGSSKPRAPRRSDDVLRLEMTRAIDTGLLSEHPSAKAIQTALGVGQLKAQMLRDERAEVTQ